MKAFWLIPRKQTTIRITCEVPGCKRSFTEKIALRQHKSAAHSKPQTANSKCPVCNKVFALRIDMEQHHSEKHPTQAHPPQPAAQPAPQPASTPSSQYTCNVPGCTVIRSFPEQSALVQHISAKHPSFTSLAPAFYMSGGMINDVTRDQHITNNHFHGPGL